MIIVRISGGLGNQLFQYALARRLQENAQEEVRIDVSKFHPLLQGKITPRDFALDCFNVTLKKTTLVQNVLRKIRTNFLKTMHVVHDKTTFVFNGSVLIHTSKAYFLGNWANFRYGTPIKQILLKEFTLKNPLSEEGARILQQEESSNSVSVHIRRGDYVQHQSKFIELKKDYYEKAVSILRERTAHPKFFIFSDDGAYVKTHFHELFGEDVVYVSESHLSDFEEMVLMSKCKHNIIANSTFSLWAAWLNQNDKAIVVAPKKYRADDADDSDLIPSGLDWLQI
ncbi:MAG: alpha-1,2-fucosyltransferase [Patescibacteria group bacterium]